MKPIIGIILRDSQTSTNREINIVYKDIVLAIKNSGGIPIGVPSSNNINNYLSICNGFIFQGGDDIDKNNLDILKIFKEKDIPVLGICLGMQEMFYEDNLIDISNHKINNLHEIKVYKNTLLYKILKKEKILVNSRHKSAINNTKYVVSSKSKDNIIESIEDTSKKFYLGLQWHPENMYKTDTNSKKIFDYFIKVCKN